MDLVDRMLSGDQKALARLITIVEREADEVPHIMGQIHPHLGKAYTIGITGPPGAGKSTLVDRLTAVIRKQGHTVGIIGVDPTSPFSGGAVLGDRIRMQQHFLDDGVFIRSMATRGSHGGLPRTALSVIKLMDAAHKDFVLVETVGVGQTELDIVETADTTVVVLVPEAGDTIQTMKAGLIEIADVFVVNKADREGASTLVAELSTMVQLFGTRSWWRPPVLATQAVNNVGIEELFEAIQGHHKTLVDCGRLAAMRQEHRRREFIHMVEQKVTDRLVHLIESDGRLSAYMQQVESGAMDPHSAAVKILEDKALVKEWLGSLER